MRCTGLSVVCGLALIISACASDGGLIIEDGALGSVLNDDAELSVKVKRALRNSPRTAILNVNVATVGDDTVRIKGFVNTTELRYEDERVAGNVEGVRHVFNDLAIR